MEVKTGNGLVRNEVGLDLTKEEYERLHYDFGIELLKPIKKHYKEFVLFEKYMMDTSCIDDDWYYAEIEFPSETAAKAFAFSYPDWVEVTGIDMHQMKNYWRRTRLGES